MQPDRSFLRRHAKHSDLRYNVEAGDLEASGEELNLEQPLRKRARTSEVSTGTNNTRHSLLPPLGCDDKDDEETSNIVGDGRGS